MKSLIKWIDERDIGFLRLYARSWKKADFAGWYGERHIIRMKTDPYGAQCYIISRQAATRFRNSVKDIVCPFDDEMAHFWENGLELYTLFPFPLCERAITSSINSQRNSQDQKFYQEAALPLSASRSPTGYARRIHRKKPLGSRGSTPLIAPKVTFGAVIVARRHWSSFSPGFIARRPDSGLPASSKLRSEPFLIGSIRR